MYFSRQMKPFTRKGYTKNGQVTYIAPLDLIPLLCSHPGGLKGAGRIRLARANVVHIHAFTNYVYIKIFIPCFQNYLCMLNIHLS